MTVRLGNLAVIFLNNCTIITHNTIKIIFWGRIVLITNGFTYLAIVIFIAAIITHIPLVFRGKAARRVFSFAPPVVLIYVIMMILCTLKVWSLENTAAAYQSVRNPVLYSMIFLMLLRCDLRKILKLGPRMLLGFFFATFSIGAGFIVSYSLFKNQLGNVAWKSLGALCGSWMGGGGNMLAVCSALNISENDLSYALVMDSVCATIYVIFLLWAIGFADKFNLFTRANTKIIDEVGESLINQESMAKEKKMTFQSILLLLGSSLLVGALSGNVGMFLSSKIKMFDAATWTVLIITVLGVALALTPFGKIYGTEQISNVMLYIVIALIASRADISAVENTHIWLLAGLVVLIFHVIIMVILAKLFRIDIFTCAIASLANIGGTATAPVLAGTYNSALVPVGVIMALLGYVVGTGGGLIVARIMSVI